jgi:hypothetical protein
MRGIITYTDFGDNEGMFTVYGPDNQWAQFTDIPKTDGWRKWYLLWGCHLVVTRKKGKLKARIDKGPLR